MVTWGTSNTGTLKTSDLKKSETSIDSSNNLTSSSKKNKSSDNNSISKPTKKTAKVKKERRIKQRNPTEKHLIDFDKQCGVELPEGGYCARSLTCKSHSMGSKRAVEGRSKSFDELLADYHREHQTKIGAANERRAKQQELQRLQRQMIKEQKEQKRLLQKAQSQAKRANSTSKQSRSGTKSKTDKKIGNYGSNNRNNSTSNNGNNNNNSRTSQYGASSKQNGSNDNWTKDQLIMTTPEEETTYVLNGISRSFPLPLESTILSTTRFRTKYFRMREMFASSFNVKPNHTSPGYGAIHSRVGCLDIDRTTDYKFRIRTPQLQLQTNMINGNNTLNISSNNTNIQFNSNNIIHGNINVSNMTPKQLQKLQLQQQKMLQLQRQQMLLQQSRLQQQQIHRQQPQNSSTVAYNQHNDFTAHGIQLQQQSWRKQQLEQQNFETAASSHLNNSDKSIQTPNGIFNVDIHGSNSGTPVNI